MKKPGRNELCPCGSGKKFKKCHLGREDELLQGGKAEFSAEMSARITSLPEVDYGRAREILDAIEWEKLSGSKVGIRLVDLAQYRKLDLSGRPGDESAELLSGGLLINLLKTRLTDPDNIYIALTPDISDSALIHEIAHALDFVAGSGVVGGSVRALSYEIGIPVEHLEHPHEFGYWLRFLRDKLGIELDADDTVIDFLYENKLLIKGRDVEKQDHSVLLAQSQRMLKFLSDNSAKIDALICERPGYIGTRQNVY